MVWPPRWPGGITRCLATEPPNHLPAAPGNRSTPTGRQQLAATGITGAREVRGRRRQEAPSGSSPSHAPPNPEARRAAPAPPGPGLSGRCCWPEQWPPRVTRTGQPVSSRSTGRTSCPCSDEGAPPPASILSILFSCLLHSLTISVSSCSSLPQPFPPCNTPPQWVRGVPRWRGVRMPGCQMGSVTPPGTGRATQHPAKVQDPVCDLEETSVAGDSE